MKNIPVKNNQRNTNYQKKYGNFSSTFIPKMMYRNSEKVFSKLEKFIIILSRNNYSSKNSIEITFPFNIICYVIMCYVSKKKSSFFVIKVIIHTQAQTDAIPTYRPTIVVMPLQVSRVKVDF